MLNKTPSPVIVTEINVSVVLYTLILCRA